MSAPSIIGPVTKTVAPTPTTCITLDVRTVDMAVVHLTQLAAGQTFSGYIEARLSEDDDFAPLSAPDLSAVTTAAPAVAQVDTQGITEIRVRGSQSGAGGDVRLRCFGGNQVA